MDTWELLSRIGLAFLAGLILGMERESHGRAAGLRTTTLVSVASCLVMILSDSFYAESLRLTGNSPSWHPDPARLAAGVLAGMGFLGAGVIMRQNQIVRGVTTAAVLWFASILGLAFGAGALWLGIIGGAVGLLTLALLPALERLVQNDWYSTLVVSVRTGVQLVEPIQAVLRENRITVKSIELDTDLDAGIQRVSAQLKYKKGDLIHLPVIVSESLGKLEGVKRIEGSKPPCGKPDSLGSQFGASITVPSHGFDPVHGQFRRRLLMWTSTVRGRTIVPSS
jgi:putative Mg2+ transporter-C (MgtC) family protein